MKKELRKNSSDLEEKNFTGLPLPIEEWLIKKQTRDYLERVYLKTEYSFILLAGIFILGIIALIHFW